MWLASAFVSPVGMAGPTGAVEPAPDSTLVALQQIDARVTNVGFRLSRAAIDYCDRRVGLTGISVHASTQYIGKDRHAALTTFGLGDYPAVLAVAAGSPAARAGVQPNDWLVAIAGKSMRIMAGENGYAPVGAVLDALDALPPGAPATLVVRRGGRDISLDIQPEPGCATRYQTSGDTELNAQADGRYVEITTGMVAFVPDDAQLAAVLGHELAHNILRHQERLGEAETARRAGATVSSKGKLSKEVEKEADRLGVYIVAAAGYPVEAIETFRTRINRARRGISLHLTHPNEHTRLEIVTAEIARLRMLEASHLPLRPDFMASPELPPLR